MSAHAYLKWPSDRGSWHALVLVDDIGWHLRCGRLIRYETAPARASIPSDEKSCESCAVLTLRDEDAPGVDNDEVPA